MRRDDLGVRLHMVGAGELYLMVLVGLRGKIGFGRYNSTTGQKPSFRRLPANIPIKLWPGFAIWSSAGGALDVGPPDTFS